MSTKIWMALLLTGSLYFGGCGFAPYEPVSAQSDACLFNGDCDFGELCVDGFCELGEGGFTQCRDNIDNDGNGLVDCEELSCQQLPNICSESAQGTNNTSPSPDDQNASYIVGGEQSREFASTGALTVNEQSFCTATLITPSKVLTAAHCVNTMFRTGISFSLGIDPGAPVTKRAITSISVHPGYIDFDNNNQASFDNGHDLAVLTLESPIAEVEPAVLLLEEASLALDTSVRLVGYGAQGVVVDRYTGPRTFGDGLRRAATVTFIELLPETLKYSFMGMGSCNGDSGGPAFIKRDNTWYQVGVTSFGDTRCTINGYYQRLDVHADWLRAEVPELNTTRQQSCAEDQRCDGQCQIDEDCASLLCPSGTCPVSNGACAADGRCEDSCFDVDPDCQSRTEPVDYCVVYGLHSNGVCNPQCPSDPECQATETMGTGCNPVRNQVEGTQCVYYDAAGQVCGARGLGQVLLDPPTASCVVLDVAGQVCGRAPASFSYDPRTNICTYFVAADPSTICYQSYPYCDPYGNCSC